MIKSRKLISIFVSAAMLVTMLSAFTTVASAEETAQAYTVHLWETFESSKDSSLKNTDATFTSIDGVYNNGSKFTYNGTKNSNYAQFSFALNTPITIAEALKKNLTVEVEFDYYVKDRISDNNDNFFYMTSAKHEVTKYASKFEVRSSGQTKVYNPTNKKSDDVLNADQANITNFGTYKIVMHAEPAGYSDPFPNATNTTTVPTWVLDEFWYNGEKQEGRAKYVVGSGMGTYDFTHLYFRFKSDTTLIGEVGLDNLSVISYSADSSPAPDKRAFIENVINNYSEKAGTPAYVKAFDLFDKDYITTDEINEVYYMLEGSSDLYTIDDIYNSARGVKVTSNDTVGGTPILIVGAFLNDKLYDAFSVELNIANGSSETISFPAEFVVEDKASLRAFIFASVDCLVPLAKARKE